MLQKEGVLVCVNSKNTCPDSLLKQTMIIATIRLFADMFTSCLAIVDPSGKEVICNTKTASL